MSQGHTCKINSMFIAQKNLMKYGGVWSRSREGPLVLDARTRKGLGSRLARKCTHTPEC